jgi:hypothetical protein
MEIDLTPKLIGEQRERKLNRFSCSEIFYLLKGWTSIEDYVNRKLPTAQEAHTMLMGSLKHKWIQEQLKDQYQMEIKKELTFGEIEIVGVADMLHLEPMGAEAKLLKPDYGFEIKTGKLRTKASASQEYQARMYCSLFEVPFFYVVQPVINNGKLILKQLAVVRRSDIFFNNQIKKLTEFYNTKLKQYER